MNDVERRERLTVALNKEVAQALGNVGPVPVREVTQRVIEQTAVGSAEFDVVLDALCAMCVRSGLALEFTRPARIS